MFLRSHVPLAWRNLVHDKRRFAACVAGVSCAVLLLFMEFGFFNALLDSQVQLIEWFDADVVLLSKARYCLALPERFPLAQLEQARAVPDVVGVAPLYIDTNGMLWHDWQGGPERFDKRGEATARSIRVIAFNPDDRALRDPHATADFGRLRRPGNVLIDTQSRPAYGKTAAELDREVAGQEVRVAGTFALGIDFTCDASLIMSDQTYADLMARRGFPGSVLDLVDLGLISVRPGVPPEQVRDQLNRILPNDVVQAKTVAELAQDEQVFWMLSTPIGPIFLIGLVMGVCVGGVICFQILSTDIADHMKEYATLKAIGYAAFALDRIVLAEALWLTILGYVPAFLLAEGLYFFVASTTGLPMNLGPRLAAGVFLMTAGMCVVSGLLAMVKLRAADPAEVF